MMKKIHNMKTVLAAFLLAGLSATAVQAEETAASAKKTDVNYSGSYNGMQIIPNEMAIFCKINGEDVYNDSSKIRPCLNQIIAKMHNSDAQTAKEGKEDWERIRVDQLTVLMGDAAAKTAYDADYEKDKTQMQEQASKTQTEHEDVAAIAYAITSLTDNVSRLISLTAQNLKYSAIEGLALVDPAVVADVTEETGEKNGTTVNASSESSVNVATGGVETVEELTAVSPESEDVDDGNTVPTDNGGAPKTDNSASGGNEVSDNTGGASAGDAAHILDTDEEGTEDPLSSEDE